MAAAALALILANSPAASIYHAVLSFEIGFASAKLSALLWINDGLMAIFFLLVGLEIKRELLAGELSSVKRAALPAIAALGGMVVPGLIYAAVNWNDPTTLRGWAIPAATDIAFALGVLSILGSRVPTSLKIFLTALAILDDLGAIVIIGLFYTAQLSWPALALAAAGLALLFAFNRFGVRHLGPYLVVGLFVWSAVLASGIHATLAGVAVALMIPLRGVGATQEQSPLHRLERGLHPWVVYGILPIFGLANAGLSFAGMSLASLFAPVPLGIATGLFVGKQVGVMAASWLAVKGRVGTMARGFKPGADLWGRGALRHRFHHEPVYRRTGLRLGRRTEPGKARGVQRLGNRRARGLSGLAFRRRAALLSGGYPNRTQHQAGAMCGA